METIIHKGKTISGLLSSVIKLQADSPKLAIKFVSSDFSSNIDWSMCNSDDSSVIFFSFRIRRDLQSPSPQPLMVFH